MRKMKDSGIAWIGEIPEEWICRQCKTILLSNDGGIWGNDPLGNGSDKIVIRSTEQTIDGKWCIENPAMRDLSLIDCRKARIQKGDLLITKSSGSDLHIGKTTLADDYFIDHECYFSNFIQRIRCKKSAPKFLWYLFNSPIIREQCVYLQNSTSGLGNINASMIRNLYIPIPPLPEQRRIAAFLDEKCAHIDAVIEKTRASIDEYKKLKPAIITRAVTKGLRQGRKMKDSGIEWIGEIPQEWEILSFTKGLHSIVDYRGKTPEKLTEGTLLITARNIKDGKIDYDISREYVRTKDIDEIMHRGKVEIGDVLFTTEAPLGAVANADRTDFALAQRIIKFQGIPEKLNNYYLKYWIMSETFQQNLATFSTGSTAKGIKASKLGMLKQVLPPLSEQQEIAAYLDAKTAAIDRLIAKKEQLIAEMQSCKKSLIYEVVTGKREMSA